VVAWPLVPMPAHVSITTVGGGGAATRLVADYLITILLHPMKDPRLHPADLADTRPKAAGDPQLPTITVIVKAMLAFAAVASILSMHLLIGPVELGPAAVRAPQAALERQPSGFD